MDEIPNIATPSRHPWLGAGLLAGAGLALIGCTVTIQGRSQGLEQNPGLGLSALYFDSADWTGNPVAMTQEDLQFQQRWSGGPGRWTPAPNRATAAAPRNAPTASRNGAPRWSSTMYFYWVNPIGSSGTGKTTEGRK